MNKTNTMKRIRIHLILFSLLMTGIACYSQSPNLISYQTVIRNGNNELVSNTTIGVRISILGGPEANVLVYQEEHTVKTNINGLAYLTIGNGKILNGLITSIDWSKGPYFIKSETDPTGGKNYTIVVLSQMLSVPYAIYSSTAEKLTGTLPEIDPLFNGSIAKGITAIDTSYWNKKLNSSDTSRMLANYLKKSEAITTGGVETDPVFNGSIAKGITATDTSYWNKKLNTSDTSGMLANYRTGLNQKLNITDTAKMLVPYLRDADTTNMLANYRTSINNKLDAKDTTLMLSNYLKKSEAVNSNGIETDPLFNGSIAKGITAKDTSYWNKKLNTSDTSGMLTNYRTGLNQKLNITDTTKMLVPYLRDADTTNMLANYRTSINNKLDVKDTTLMLSNYLKKSEGLNESDPLFNVSIAKGITATDTSYWNKKLNSTDTSGMLANYRTSLNQKLNITDTAKMLVPYLRDSDTSNMLTNYRISINNKLDAKDTTLMLSNYLKIKDTINLSSRIDSLYIKINEIDLKYSNQGSNLPNVKLVSFMHSENSNFVVVRGEILPGPTSNGYGICLGPNPNPTIHDSYVSGSNLGNNQFTIWSNFSNRDSIYVSCYISSNNGVSYSREDSIINNQAPSTQIYQVGDLGPSGGKILFDKGNYSYSWRYIEVCPIDLNSYYSEGGCGSFQRPPLNTDIGNGGLNTFSLLLPENHNPYCGSKYFDPAEAMLKFEFNNFSDWVIPSKDELKLIYDRKNLFNLENVGYWSSSYYDDANPWVLNFNSGQWFSVIGNYGISAKIRPIRYF